MWEGLQERIILNRTVCLVNSWINSETLWCSVRDESEQRSSSLFTKIYYYILTFKPRLWGFFEYHDTCYSVLCISVS